MQKPGVALYSQSERRYHWVTEGAMSFTYWQPGSLPNWLCVHLGTPDIYSSGPLPATSLLPPVTCMEKYKVL